MNLSAIRTIRVLRPLRAINRIPSELLLLLLLMFRHDNRHTNERNHRLLADVVVFNFFRYEDIGDALARYIAHARQCPVALFFRLFHLWHRRCPTLGRNPPAEMLPRSTQGHRPTSNFVSAGR